MEKSFLEKKIRALAVNRLVKDVESIKTYLISSAFNNLTFKINDTEYSIINFFSYCNIEKIGEENMSSLAPSNMASVRDELLSKYEEEETKNVLQKIESLNYLFNS